MTYKAWFVLLTLSTFMLCFAALELAWHWVMR